MRVALNGLPTELPDESTVADAVEAAGAGTEPRGVAVAVDGEVIRRVEWRTTSVEDGQAIEVVRAVQGG